ncbi:MAG: hypothetical protein LBS92_01665, partial [Candidatus Methanoplasma sp.]|nr:hypothetical protein [Candidatus Methanoplasma sp.]
YRFVEWTGDAPSSSNEAHVYALASDVRLTAVLEGGEAPAFDAAVAVAASLAIVAAILAAVAFSCRSYDVRVVGSEGLVIEGKGKARRKKPYSFKVSGDSDVRYRIGDGEWKTPVKTADGYNIPEGEVTASVTVEAD